MSGLLSNLNFAETFSHLIVSALPLGFHAADKMLEEVSFQGLEQIKRQMALDPRGFLKKSIEAKPELLVAIEGYYKTERSIHFILSIGVFCIINVLISQFEAKPGTNLLALRLCGIIAVLVFLLTFYVDMTKRGFQPWLARPPELVWKRRSYVMLALVTVGLLIIEWSS